MTAPQLSVIVGQYRPRGFLKPAVQSVLDQLEEGPDTEIIVSLGSPDPEFEAWARAYPAIRVIPGNEPVMGRMLARAAEQARGEAICFLDDDDRFRPGKLSRIEALFLQDPSLAFYHHEMDFIDDRGEPTLPPGLRPTVRRKMVPGRTVYLPGSQKLAQTGRLAHVGPDFNSSCMAVRRAALRPFLRDLGRMKAGPDAFLFFVVGMLSEGSIRCDGDRWTDYRVHSSDTRPAGGVSDPRVFLQNVSLGHVAGQSELVDIVRPRQNRTVSVLAEACVESHRFFAELRSPTPTRSGWARAFVRVLPYWRTFVIRTNWLALAGSAGMLIAPGPIQSLYLRRTLGRKERPRSETTPA